MQADFWDLTSEKSSESNSWIKPAHMDMVISKNLHKALFSSFIFTFISIPVLFAQSDSSAYEAQRKRVNSLLQERSAKFARFEESLNAKTGIFGLKTKKDMQASINILRDVVLSDNQLFKETKALLEFKDIEQASLNDRAEQSSERIDGYIRTISKLQSFQDTLQAELEKSERKNNRYLISAIVLR